MNEFVQKELLWDALKLSVPDTKDLFFQSTPNISIQCAPLQQKEIWGLEIFSQWGSAGGLGMYSQEAEDLPEKGRACKDVEVYRKDNTHEKLEGAEGAGETEGSQPKPGCHAD